MTDPPEEPPPATAKVQISVAGHEILIEGPASVETLTAAALHLFEKTAGYAQRIPLGYSIPPPDITLAPDFTPPDGEGIE